MVNKLRIKQRLESPKQLNEQRGTLETRYLDSPLQECAKQAITHALFKYHMLDLSETIEQASTFLNVADAVLLDEPSDETETLPLLKQERIEYPDFYNGLSPLPHINNTLD